MRTLLTTIMAGLFALSAAAPRVPPARDVVRTGGTGNGNGNGNVGNNNGNGNTGNWNGNGNLGDGNGNFSLGDWMGNGHRRNETHKDGFCRDGNCL